MSHYQEPHNDWLNLIFAVVLVIMFFLLLPFLAMGWLSYCNSVYKTLTPEVKRVR